jgi:tRNA (guanine37-N1)-methyltransferase
MHFAVVTLFPEMIRVLESTGVIGRAIREGVAQLSCFDPRDDTHDRHRSVDDRPYGGGPGMVMMVEPLRDATRRARAAVGGEGHTVYLTPQGRRFEQRDARRLAAAAAVVLVCGRYEGVDERFIDSEVDEELSLGDFVLSGGEIPAMAVIDAVTRLLPGVLGCDASASEDSFAEGLLDCPHYTRPEEFEGRAVPPVLRSGDHAAVARWRRMQSLGRTAQRRPDLLAAHGPGSDELELLEEYWSAAGVAKPSGGGEEQ